MFKNPSLVEAETADAELGRQLLDGLVGPAAEAVEPAPVPPEGGVEVLEALEQEPGQSWALAAFLGFQRRPMASLGGRRTSERGLGPLNFR